ncbi:MAG: RteC domain-containing protein [Candidatus Moranbacteria bacterium]|nr:RteC domain-containing protein [Candidatus Moranbacteria bacterium]
MINFCEKLHREFEEQLNFIALEQENILIRAELSASVCEKALARLKEFTSKRKFKDSHEEILFFKTIKPKFTSKLKYFILLFNLESKRPKSSEKLQKIYLEKALDRLDYYLEDNLEFYTYTRTGATYLDDKYFMRGKADIHLILDDCFFSLDKDFTTSHENKIARIIANDMLAVYIKNEIFKLECIGGFSPLMNPQLSTLTTWTEKKVSLIELIYALHTSRCINNGTTDIRELSEFFSKIFNVELGDVYRTYVEIKARSNPTHFLDTLKTHLSKKIYDELE